MSRRAHAIAIRTIDCTSRLLSLNSGSCCGNGQKNVARVGSDPLGAAGCFHCCTVYECMCAGCCKLRRLAIRTGSTLLDHLEGLTPIFILRKCVSSASLSAVFRVFPYMQCTISDSLAAIFVRYASYHAACCRSLRARVTCCLCLAYTNNVVNLRRVHRVKNRALSEQPCE